MQGVFRRDAGEATAGGDWGSRTVRGRKARGVSRLAACSISGCDRTRTRLASGAPSKFCDRHRANAERNRCYDRPRLRRAELGRVARKAEGAPGISSADWGAFLAAMDDYREQMLDASLKPATVTFLNCIADPVERHVARETLARAAGRVPYSKVLDLALAVDPDTGDWRVEELTRIGWTP